MVKIINGAENISREEILPLIEKSETFCILPFTHSEIEPLGVAFLCCQSTEKLKTDDDEFFIFGKHNHNDLWKGKQYRKIRKDIIEGKKVKECNVCYNVEKNNGTSTRHLENQKYTAGRLGTARDYSININTGNKHASPITWDIRLNNICNLKCRMCSPDASSQIRKEMKDNPKLVQQNLYLHSDADIDDHLGPKARGYRPIPGATYDAKDPTDIIKTLPFAEKLTFLGGEPTLQPEVQFILDEAIAQGRFDIELDITTNLTNVTDRWLESLSRFDMVFLQFSLDGVGPVNDYIRSNSNWGAIESNCQKYLEIEPNGKTEWQFSIHQTVNMYNILNFWEVHRWQTKMRKMDRYNRIPADIKNSHPWHMYVANYPSDMHISNLPKKYRERLLKKIALYDKEMVGSDSSITGIKEISTILRRPVNEKWQENLMSLLYKSKTMDNLREKHMKDCVPELWDILQEFQCSR